MKNYKYKLYFIVLAAATLLNTSCADLDLEPKDKISGERLFSDPEGVKQYMANLYYQLPVEDFSFSPQRGFNVNDWEKNQNTGGVVLDSYAIDGCHSAWTIGLASEEMGWWEEGYLLNRDVNLLIEEIPNLQIDEYQKKLLIGETAFIRAYIYFALAKRYGGVCLIKEIQEYTPGKIDNLFVPRSTEKETWDFVIEECDRAIANLPEDVRGWGASERRATKWAALALKSRVALHAASLAKYWNEAPLSGNAVSQKLVGIDGSEANRYYEESIKASTEIMESGRFGLYKPNPANPEEAAANYQAIFETPGIAPEETIFIKGFVRPGLNTSHNYDIWYNPQQTASGWPHPGRMNPTFDFVEVYETYDNPGQFTPIITTTSGVPDDPNGFDPNKEYLRFDSPADIFKNRDARFFASVNYPHGEWKGIKLVIQGGIVKPDGSSMIGTDGSYTHDGVTYYTFGGRSFTDYSGFSTYGAGNMTRSGFLMRKFLSEKVNVDASWNQSITDFIDMRYAEVLLNYAEAVIECGYTANNAQQKAKDAINDIRKRAGHTVESPLTLGNVLKERRIELAFENKNFWDLIRRREFHKELDARRRLGLMPLIDLRGDKPQYIMVKIYLATEHARSFEPLSYYRPIPGINTTGITQNPQY